MIPPVGDKNIFPANVYNTAILEVPEAALEDYRNSSPWEYFVSISADGVFNLNSEKNGFYRVFNLYGVNILNTEDKEDFRKLPSGIYIINGKKTILK